jgi:hypothetical protein
MIKFKCKHNFQIFKNKMQIEQNVIPTYVLFGVFNGLSNYVRLSTKGTI